MDWTMDDLLARLGSDVEYTERAEPSTRLGPVVLADDLGDDTPDVGVAAASVVLAVGVREEALAALLEITAERQCAAVVARCPGKDARPRAPVGCALILLRRNVSWMTVLEVLGQHPAGRTRPPGSLDTPPVGELPQGDLFALAEGLAERVGGPVIIEDANFQVLSYSSFIGPIDVGRDRAILGRRMPIEWLEHLDQSGGLDRLRTTEDVIDVVAGPLQARRRLITAMRSGSRLLGILWVAEGQTPLPVDAPALLREAAEIAVPHMLRHYDNHQEERRGRGQLVRSLLDGRGQLHRHADELGIARSATTAVLGFTPDADLDITDDAWDRITDHVALTCAAFRWHAAVSRLGRTVFAIVEVPSGSNEEGVRRLGGEIVGRVIPVLRGRLRGATSSLGRGLGAIRARRRETEDALGALLDGDNTELPRFVHADEVRPIAVLREVIQVLDERGELWLPGLQTLVDEDAARNTEFLLTLRTWLQASCNASEASRQLNLHPTTLRYRLAKIKELSGLDLDDPRVRLVCELLLVARDRSSQR
jgi:sugar diacid utilization regulator